MRFRFDEDQEEFRQTVRAFLDRHVPDRELPRLVRSDPVDPKVWSAMAEQIGLQGLVVPERHGGSGYGMVELALVFEEAGRVLLPGALFPTIALATAVLLESGDGDAQARFLPGIAAGTTRATLAFREQGDRDGEHAHAATASPAGDGYALSGVKTSVQDGEHADLLLVSARVDGAVSLFAVEGAASGVRRTGLESLDPTRPLARVELDGVAAVAVGAPGAGAEILERALTRATIALAAEQVGGAQRCLELAVEHAKERIQFGRPIGSFQAVKHRCADVLWEIECARTATWYAAWAFESEPGELPRALPIAAACAAEAYTGAARACIQVLGGIGFTWEHPAHLHFKRATSSEQLLGSPAYHRERLARAILDAA